MVNGQAPISSHQVSEIMGRPPIVETYHIWATGFLLVFVLIMLLAPWTQLTPVLWLLVLVVALILYGVPSYAYLTGRWVASVKLSSEGVCFLLGNGKVINSPWEALALRSKKPRVGRGTVYLQLHKPGSTLKKGKTDTHSIPVTLQQGKAILGHLASPTLDLTATERARLGMV